MSRIAQMVACLPAGYGREEGDLMTHRTSTIAVLLTVVLLAGCQAVQTRPAVPLAGEYRPDVAFHVRVLERQAADAVHDMFLAGPKGRTLIGELEDRVAGSRDVPPGELAEYWRELIEEFDAGTRSVSSACSDAAEGWLFVEGLRLMVLKVEREAYGSTVNATFLADLQDELWDGAAPPRRDAKCIRQGVRNIKALVDIET